MKTYKAPWSRALVVISAASVLIVIVVTVMVTSLAGKPWISALMATALGLAVLFVVRGYAISPDAVLVRRLLWNTRLPVRHLQAVRAQPDAMRRSIRLFGNGGLFSFTGAYRNDTLGHYRAYVTDPHRSVVLKYPARTVVLSPDEPDEFVKELEAVRRDQASEA